MVSLACCCVVVGVVIVAWAHEVLLNCAPGRLFHGVGVNAVHLGRFSGERGLEVSSDSVTKNPLSWDSSF